MRNGIRDKKMAPLLGPYFKEAKWWAMSGKAMQDDVPPARTTIVEVTQKFEESEAHTEFAAS
jgi:hypothetical protein